MKKYYWLLLSCTAVCLVVWLAGCSTEQAPVSPSAPEVATTPEEPTVTLDLRDAVPSTEEGMTISLGCCLSPIIMCQGSTDSTINFRICARSTGAPGGLLIQIIPRPVNPVCRDIVFPPAAVPTFTFPIPLLPYQCLDFTLLNVPCDSGFAFRAFAVNQYNCASPPSNIVCCRTEICDELPPCPDVPTLNCQSTLSEIIELQVCAGPTGAPGGISIQQYELPAGTACADFVWPDGVPASVLGIVLAPNECINVSALNVECGKEYIYRVQAVASPPFTCPSEYSASVCCTTATCEELPLCPAPTVTCEFVPPGSNNLQIHFCNAGTTAATSVTYQIGELPAGVACADFDWATTGIAAVVGPFAPGECHTVAIANVECGSPIVAHAQMVYGEDCTPTWSANVCCEPEVPDMPTITCRSATDTTLTVRLCPGASGFTYGWTIQYAELPAGVACADFDWEPAGTEQQRYSERTIPPGCVDVTLEFMIECGTTYVLRALTAGAVETCNSEWTANICCTTADCEELPCLDAPTVQCWGETDNSLTVRICAGASGAPCGLTLMMLPLPADDASVATIDCGTIIFTPATQLFDIGPLGPNACVDYTVYNLECDTYHAFGAKAKTGCNGYDCDLGNSPTICCRTDECEDQHCVWDETECRAYSGSWPCSGLPIGNHTYSNSQLLTNLNRPVSGNSLVALSHELITAKINILRGASVSGISQIIGQSNLLIGNLDINSGFVAPTSGLGRMMYTNTITLRQFNTGNMGILACD